MPQVMGVYGYSDLLSQIQIRPDILDGILVDTNVLVSATYDSDQFNEKTGEFLDYISENSIPKFCNVNVRGEFLEIHRRIIFTEALIDYFHAVDRSKVPVEILSQLGKWASRNETRKKEKKSPLRLSESDIKGIKAKLLKITDGQDDLWSMFCADKIGNKLEAVWKSVENEIGLNFLATRSEDNSYYLDKEPSWSDAIKLIESYGVSSSDSMIVNIFSCSKLDALATSDLEMAQTVVKEFSGKKICFIPDELLADIVC